MGSWDQLTGAKGAFAAPPIVGGGGRHNNSLDCGQRRCGLSMLSRANSLKWRMVEGSPSRRVVGSSLSRRSMGSSFSTLSWHSVGSRLNRHSVLYGRGECRGLSRVNEVSGAP